MAVLPLLFRDDWTLTESGILDRTHLRPPDGEIELMTSSGLELELVATLGLLNSFTDQQYLIRVRSPA